MSVLIQWIHFKEKGIIREKITFNKKIFSYLKKYYYFTINFWIDFFFCYIWNSNATT